MIRCIAIDDEPLALKQIRSYIQRMPSLSLAGTFSNAVEAKAFIESESVELIFVDINMPEVSGIDFVRSLEEQHPMIIFTTAYSEYAVEGFKLDAIDYLLKPFSFDEFSRSVNKANSLYELYLRSLQSGETAPETEAEAEIDGNSDSSPEYISIKADYKVSLVRLADIIYIESDSEYVRLHLADGSTIMTLFRMKKMETSLPSEMFMRVHRSYIVNLRCVTGYARGRVFLNSSEYVPIGEIYKEQFQNYIAKTYPSI